MSSYLVCLFIHYVIITAALPNTRALLGPLPAAAQLLPSTNHPSLSRVALCAKCPL